MIFVRRTWVTFAEKRMMNASLTMNVCWSFIVDNMVSYWANIKNMIPNISEIRPCMNRFVWTQNNQRLDNAPDKIDISKSRENQKTAISSSAARVFKFRICTSTVIKCATCKINSRGAHLFLIFGLTLETNHSIKKKRQIIRQISCPMKSNWSLNMTLGSFHTCRR